MMTAEEFKQDVLTWAQHIGVEPREIHIRRMSRKYGSCSTKGRLTFDASLLSKDVEKRTRVMVEELLHLKFPNHGKMFKSMLNAYLSQVNVIEYKKEKKIVMQDC